MWWVLASLVAAAPSKHLLRASVDNASLRESHMSFPNQHFDTPADPVKERRHIFVLGPETSGTRLVSQIIAEDVGIPHAATWDGHFATMDKKDAVFHVSLPWGSQCQDHDVEPVLSTWGAEYPKHGNVLRKLDYAPSRLYVDPKTLLKTYEKKSERVEVILVARDPMVSLVGKMDALHCDNKVSANEEQDEAYRILLESSKLPNVKVVCYETLVTHPDTVLEMFRKDLSLKFPKNKVPHFFNANEKYTRRVPKTYPCTFALRAYNQLCPTTELAKKYESCV